MVPVNPQEMKFEILARAGRARHGALHLPHSIVNTPVFMPVGTQGTMKVSFLFYSQYCLYLGNFTRTIN